MRKEMKSWECGRHFGIEGSLFATDPEEYRLGCTLPIGGGSLGRSWRFSMTRERKARAARKARYARMARAFARRCGFGLSLGR
jgi:hypothetical protein